MLKNKIAAITIALFFILSMTAAVALMPSANAHSPPWNLPDYAFLAISPNPVQVNQYAEIVMWLNMVPLTASGTSGMRWNNFYVNVTAPNGVVTVLGPFTSEQIGGTYTTWTPTQVGKYSVVFWWPGETITTTTGANYLVSSAYIGDFAEGAVSNTVILTVQQGPVPAWQEAPVPGPTDYWTRPIQAENHFWSSIASDYLSASWLANSHVQLQGTGPMSAHILWTKPILQYGGIADSNYGAVKVGAKDYQTFMGGPNGGSPDPFQNGWPIVMDGKIYYDAYEYPFYGYYCVDLYTGQTTWYKNGTDNGLNNPQQPRAGYTLSEIFPQIDFGQMYNYYGVNGAGVEDYLWAVESGMPQTATTGGVMWYMFDANTGNWICTLKNVPVPLAAGTTNGATCGAQVTDDQGNELIYSYNPTTGQFLCWNSSQAIPPLAPTGTSEQQWKPPTGLVIDAVSNTLWTAIGPTSPFNGVTTPANSILPHSGYTMNITGPTNLPHDFMDVLQTDAKVPEEIVLYSFPANFYWANGALQRQSSGLPSAYDYFSMAVLQITKTGVYSPLPQYSATQNNNLGFGVTLLWNKVINYPITTGNMTFYIGGSPSTGGSGSGLNGKDQLIDYDDQVFCLWNQETQQYWGYSLQTGNLLWGPTFSTGAMDYYAYGGYQMDSPGVDYNGMLINAGYAGYVVAWNITTGQYLWSYNATSVGYESPYGQNYPALSATICNGVDYIVDGEHSATQPMWRGAEIRALNTTNGNLIWTLDFFPLGNNDRWLAVADGYIVAPNEYDGQLYTIGIGPSATTVSAPQSGVSLGNKFVITGTVLDASPGTQEPTQKAMYPNGVPAVSEASETAFMNYLYEQQPYPTNITGVPVTISAVDPNGNYILLGQATSDASGTYCLTVNTNSLTAGAGTYKVVASFAGSYSYAASSAETYFTVNSAAPTPAPTTPPVTGIASTGTVLLGVVAIIIVVIIIGIVLAVLTLRKRP